MNTATLANQTNLYKAIQKIAATGTGTTLTTPEKESLNSLIGLTSRLTEIDKQILELIRKAITFVTHKQLFTNHLTFNGDIMFTNTLSCSGTVSFTGSVFIDGYLTVSDFDRLNNFNAGVEVVVPIDGDDADILNVPLMEGFKSLYDVSGRESNFNLNLTNSEIPESGIVRRFTVINNGYIGRAFTYSLNGDPVGSFTTDLQNLCESDSSTHNLIQEFIVTYIGSTLKVHSVVNYFEDV